LASFAVLLSLSTLDLVSLVALVLVSASLEVLLPFSAFVFVSFSTLDFGSFVDFSFLSAAFSLVVLAGFFSVLYLVVCALTICSVIQIATRILRIFFMKNIIGLNLKLNCKRGIRWFI